VPASHTYPCVVVEGVDVATGRGFVDAGEDCGKGFEYQVRVEEVGGCYEPVWLPMIRQLALRWADLMSSP
jgi:hypothetical protein